MLDRFTERARRAVILATEEARRRRHDAIGPAHLLMGILRVGGGFVVHLLEQLRVNPETLRAQVEEILSETPGAVPGGEPAFSAELKAVLEAALGVKRRLTVDTDLLLLALLAADQAGISRVLSAAGADLARARRLAQFVNSFSKPVTEEEVRFIATSTWRVSV
jgi:ATP-dependent Clp protease ATP-binding subunit ClpC